MGMNSEATVAFGVDLGNPEYGEWHFELVDDYTLPEPWTDENPDWDELISAFAGWTEIDLPWGEHGSVEYEARGEQYRRELALRKATEIDYRTYGGENSGLYLYIVGSGQSVEWGCEPLRPLLSPQPHSFERLNEFIAFLDGKGLRLKPEHRTPGWLLMASYG